MIEYTSHSADETLLFGQQYAQTLFPNTILCFKGDLGAGKTTMIKGIVSGATGLSPDIVSSPTFVYLNIYGTDKKVYHFDLYRMRDVDQFLSMGFDEYFFSDGISCIEWSERIETALPQQAIIIEITHLEEESRLIRIKTGKS
jgi:tRNA threonylcarbamoyladenosine biosynthesis protein TsaE